MDVEFEEPSPPDGSQTEEVLRRYPLADGGIDGVEEHG
jgi:hypothetical protein